jgi:hypothetical protein
MSSPVQLGPELEQFLQPELCQKIPLFRILDACYKKITRSKELKSGIFAYIHRGYKFTKCQ